MQVLKRDDERRRIWATALISDLIDLQGDVVDDREIEDAACRMMRNPPLVKIDHQGGGVGKVCAAFPMTKEISRAFGIRPPGGRGALLVGLHVEDDATWTRVKAGEVGHAVSIGGVALHE